MPSEFDTTFADSGRPLMLGFLGEPVVVTKPDATSYDGVAIVSMLDGGQVTDATGVSLDYHGAAQMSLLLADGGIPAATTQYKLTIRGIIYNVISVEPHSGMVTLKLYRRDVQEVSRDIRGAY